MIRKYYRRIRYRNLVTDKEVMALMPALPFKKGGAKLTHKEIMKLFRILKDDLIRRKLEEK